MNCVTSTFLLVPQNGVNNYCVLCRVKAKKTNKNLQQITCHWTQTYFRNQWQPETRLRSQANNKELVVFHNHSPLLTMHRSNQIYMYMYLYSCCHSMLNWIPRIKRTNTRDVWLNQEVRDLSCTDCWLTNMALSPNERRELTMRDNALFFKRWHFYLRTESTLYELKPCVSLYL